MTFSALTAATISCAFVFGMLIALLGSIKRALAERLSLTEDRVGTLVTAVSAAMIPTMLLSGVIMDAIGLRLVLFFGSFVIAAALSLLAITRTFGAALGAMMLVGLGGACLSVAATLLMPRAFFPEQMTASQNLGNVFFGVGALVVPVLTEWLIERLGYRKALGLLAIISLTPALWAAFTPGDQFGQPDMPELATGVFSHPVLWIVGAAFWFYMCIENLLTTWATTYLAEVGMKPKHAALALSGFWFTFLAGRGLMAYLLRGGIVPAESEGWLIVVFALGASVVLGNLASTQRPEGGILALLLAGLMLGPIFPTLVGILLNDFPGGQQGTAYGTMFALGMTSILIVPPCFGSYARKNSVHVALRIPVVIGIALTIVGLLLSLGLPLFRVK